MDKTKPISLTGEQYQLIKHSILTTIEILKEDIGKNTTNDTLMSFQQEALSNNREVFELLIRSYEWGPL